MIQVDRVISAFDKVSGLHVSDTYIDVSLSVLRQIITPLKRDKITYIYVYEIDEKSAILLSNLTSIVFDFDSYDYCICACRRDRIIEEFWKTDIRVMLPGDVPLELVLVEAGSFTMGSADREADKDEMPLHQVTLTQDYYLSKYPVTQLQWKAIMLEEQKHNPRKPYEYEDEDELIGGRTISEMMKDIPDDSIGGMDINHPNPMNVNPSTFKGNNLPVDSVVTSQIELFLEALNKYVQVPGRFVLPTEAQWEFAARGGNYSEGYQHAGSSYIDEVAWHRGNADNKTHPVGQKLPNEIGLYDMSGNVWEFCADTILRPYTHDAIVDPVGVGQSEEDYYVVLRGGSYQYSSKYSRVACRFNDAYNQGQSDAGFRICLIPNGV